MISLFYSITNYLIRDLIIENIKISESKIVYKINNVNK